MTKRFQHSFTIVLLLALTIACSAWAAVQDAEKFFTKGESLYNAQKYGPARESFTKAAEQGHVRAHTYLGFMYANGLGVPKDKTKAIDCWTTAALQGDDVAQHNLTSRGVTLAAPASPTLAQSQADYAEINFKQLLIATSRDEETRKALEQAKEKARIEAAIRTRIEEAEEAEKRAEQARKARMIAAFGARARAGDPKAKRILAKYGIRYPYYY